MFNGKFLRDWRTRRAGAYRRGRAAMVGWTQADAAAWYGCSERQWRRWENGETPIPVHVIRRLAQWTTEELFTATGGPNGNEQES